MKHFRRAAAILLALTAISVPIFADDESQTIEKVYIISSESAADSIPTEPFTEDGIEYVFEEFRFADNISELTRRHTETVSLETNTTNAEKVIALFEPTKTVTTDDGFSGLLEFDYTTLKIETAGYASCKVDVTEERSYPNLASADTSLVPKTIDKNGVTLTLTDIKWSSTAGATVDGIAVDTRYTAAATYTGTDTKTYISAYTASADYVGELTKTVRDSVTCTAVFVENPKFMELIVPETTSPPSLEFPVTEKKDYANAAIAAVSIAGAATLAGGGYVLYRVIRHIRKGY